MEIIIQHSDNYQLLVRSQNRVVADFIFQMITRNLKIKI